MGEGGYCAVSYPLPLDGERVPRRGGKGALAVLALTGSFNLCYASILRVHEGQTFELQVAYSEFLADTQSGNVNLDAVGDIGVDTINLQLTHLHSELTTGLNTLGVTNELYGNSYGNGLLSSYLEEVDVQTNVLNRVELILLNNSNGLLVTDGEVNSQCVRAVDQFTYVLCLYGEGRVLALTIEVAGNQVLLAECLSGFLAELRTGSSNEIKSFHCSFVLLKIGSVTWVLPFPIARLPILGRRPCLTPYYMSSCACSC